MSGSTSSTTTYINVKVTPDPGFALVFDAMTATEALGRPFLYELQMSSIKAQGELMSLLGSSVTVSITLPDKSKRYFNGIVARVAYAGLRGGAFSYRIELRPWIWLLSRTQDCQIFQNMSAYAIISQIFQNAGFSDVQDKRQNQAGSTELEFCVQYRETAFDFVTRLMEQWGLYYFFQHADGKHTLVICDDPNSHASIGAAIPFQADQTELRAVEDHIWQWSSELMVMPGKFTYRDYNFTTPTADLETRSTLSGSHTYGTLEVYDYPGPYDTTDNGQKLADVRMQDLNSRRQILYGTSNSRRLYTGCKFTLSKFYQDSGEYGIHRDRSDIYIIDGGRLRHHGRRDARYVPLHVPGDQGQHAFPTQSTDAAADDPRTTDGESGRSVRRRDHHRPVWPGQSQILLGPQLDAGREQLVLDQGGTGLGGGELGRHLHPARRAGGRGRVPRGQPGPADRRRLRP